MYYVLDFHWVLFPIVLKKETNFIVISLFLLYTFCTWFFMLKLQERFFTGLIQDRLLKFFKIPLFVAMVCVMYKLVGNIKSKL